VSVKIFKPSYRKILAFTTDATDSKQTTQPHR